MHSQPLQFIVLSYCAVGCRCPAQAVLAIVVWLQLQSVELCPHQLHPDVVLFAVKMKSVIGNTTQHQ
jgi:hypothetical protein